MDEHLARRDQDLETAWTKTLDSDLKRSLRYIAPAIRSAIARANAEHLSHPMTYIQAMMIVALHYALENSPDVPAAYELYNLSGSYVAEAHQKFNEPYP